jgi:GGDEF domain-containing protein
MLPTETVPTNGRAPSSVEAAVLRRELNQQRAICARQAMVIDQLDEDVAMFRHAVVALIAQRARGFGRGAQRPKEPLARAAPPEDPGLDRPAEFAEARDERATTRDPLTGALARHAGVRCIEQEIARARRTGEALARQ